MIKLGQRDTEPSPVPGNVLVYATEDGLEIKNENGQVLNLRDLYDLASNLQLYVFGVGYAREKFSDLPTDVPVGSHALHVDSGAVYRAAEWPTLERIVWIPSEAYGVGGAGEYQIVAALTGSESDETEVNQSGLVYRVLTGPSLGVDPEVIYTGNGIQINFGVNEPIPAPFAGSVTLGTDEFGPLPGLYDDQTTVWVVCEAETLSSNPQLGISVRPVVFSNGDSLHVLGEILDPLNLYTANDAMVTNNVWYTGSEQMLTTGGNLIVFKYSPNSGDPGKTGFTEVWVDGKPYRSAGNDEFASSLSGDWGAAFTAIVDVGASASILIRKYTVIVREAV